MEEDKLPLKRVELSLSKFNEVAIPHHLGLLRQHRTNILKFEEAGDYPRVRAEQLNARRVAAQLRALLQELEGLRAQVRGGDLPRFDQLTRRARDQTRAAVMDYLETSPLAIIRRADEGAGAAAAGSAVSTESVGVVAHAQHEPPELLQLQLDEQEAALRSRAAVLHGWAALQDDVRALHAAWAALHEQARAQAEPLAASERRVEQAAEHVAQGRGHLAVAERLRAGAYGLGGAALGGALGGPLGLVVGAKAGAAAALAGSLLGYVGARALGARRQDQIEDSQKRDEQPKEKDKDE